ncbi:hypothetical protein [Flavobacterium soyangense]|uniref:Uncharacterized protein n=1 Tax=Flavobacterium soyangense TaxID=2023265 RepID=A0A930U5U6_9FLAO|nr:hypothetical protein [Flavobacterium soyangense]MBF2707428.1 hypothetical protein [Flavobacterium soyangense]
MPKYDRIKLELTDLSPKSASMVFEFLHILLEEHLLDLNYFKDSISNYSIREQYFIFKYAKSYFGYNSNSYLYDWLKKQGIDNQTNDENKILDLINTNSSNILNYIENNEKTTERRFKFYKKNESNYLIGGEIRYKIPLRSLTTKVQLDENPEFLEKLKLIDKKKNDEFKIENYLVEKASDYFLEFKSEVFRLLTGLFDKNQVKELFYNSFSTGNNTNPICLNIEFKNSAELYNAFFEIYELYNSEKNSSLRSKQIIEHKKQTKEIKKVRKGFKTKPSNKKITKLDIMKVMYNSFPQIRDSYKDFVARNPSTDLDKYLLTKSRNIRKS